MINVVVVLPSDLQARGLVSYARAFVHCRFALLFNSRMTVTCHVALEELHKAHSCLCLEGGQGCRFQVGLT